MSYVVYVCDTETTGLDHEKNDIIEISLWRSLDDAQKTWYLRAVNPETISDKALQVNGHKKEDILLKTAEGRSLYKEPSDVVAEIEEWILEDNVPIEDRIIVGQNIQFDINFIKELWKRTGNSYTYPFSRLDLDIIQVVRFIDLCTGKRRKRYNLINLIKAFGISKAKAHRAEGDVKMTKDLFQKIISSVENPMKEAFDSCYIED